MLGAVACGLGAVANVVAMVATGHFAWFNVVSGLVCVVASVFCLWVSR